MVKKKNGKRQNLRRTLLLVTWLLFPIVMNFLSPYVIIDGAFQGIVSGSFILFGILFISSLFLGRLWCSWVCPAAGIQEACFTIKDKRLQGKRIDWIKWLIWLLWIAVIILGFITAGGLTRVDALHLTDTGISVDAPEKYFIYYIVTGIIFVLAVLVGKRAFCHTSCWMAPFMIIGRKIRNFLNTPALHLTADSEKCINCKKCTRSCPMSLDVNKMVQDMKMENAECILCGSCIDVCPEGVIHYAFKPSKS